MQILNPGDPWLRKPAEFRFKCKECGCEWEADRTDKGLYISPPGFPFFTRMRCPNCGKLTYDRKWK